MENESIFKEMLQSNLPENNLLTLELMLNQVKWDPERALRWIINTHLEQSKNVEQLDSIPFGDIILKFEICWVEDGKGHGDNISWAYDMMLEFRINKHDTTVFKYFGDYIKTDTVENKALPNFESYKNCITKGLNSIIPELVRFIYPY